MFKFVKYFLTQMIALYDYYGLEVFFKKDISLPISVYARRDNKESCIRIEFKDGLVKSVAMDPEINALDADDAETFMLLTEKNISEIVKSWLDAFIYNKEVSSEIIKINIRENA